MIIEKNMEVSYCGLGAVYQHHQRSRERKRKKIVSQDSRSPIENWTQILFIRSRRTTQPTVAFGAHLSGVRCSIKLQCKCEYSDSGNVGTSSADPCLKSDYRFVKQLLFPFMSCQQNAGQNYNIKIGKRSFEKVWNFIRKRHKHKLHADKLRAEKVRRMPAIVQSRSFRLPVSLKKHKCWTVAFLNFACFVRVWNLVPLINP
jgi:hypothetical protein